MIAELWVESPKVVVVHRLKDQGGSLGLFMQNGQCVRLFHLVGQGNIGDCQTTNGLALFELPVGLAQGRTSGQHLVRLQGAAGS